VEGTESVLRADADAATGNVPGRVALATGGSATPDDTTGVGAAGTDSAEVAAAVSFRSTGAWLRQPQRTTFIAKSAAAFD
jgi:hypothetical protein